MKIHYISDLPGSADMPMLAPFCGEDQAREILVRLGGWNGQELQIMCEPEVHNSFLLQGHRVELICAKSDSNTDLRKAVQTYTSRFGNKLGLTWNLYLGHFANRPEAIEACVQGTVLGSYKVGMYKSSANDIATLDELHIFGITAMHPKVERAVATAGTQKKVFDLVNAPSNHKSPETLADWARKSGRQYGYKVTVLEEDELVKQGFHGLLAVNRGSESPARFIICDYDPEGAERTVALVGKGVTFDTGGISIKPSNNMHYMKSDMGGAAAVLGAVELISKLKLKIRVIGFVPATDNSVDAKAIKPGDVIGSYSGKTIEVLNTDAEGRLILADALNYAVKKYTPDYVIDLATLTGNVVRALGTHCAGLFTNSDDLANQLEAAGRRTGERLWRLPLWDEYGAEMKSDIADLKNLSDKPLAGAITAAKFLENFTEGHRAWAHLDVAGVAFKGNGISRAHTATAFGVRLLQSFVEELTY